MGGGGGGIIKTTEKNTFAPLGIGNEGQCMEMQPNGM